MTQIIQQLVVLNVITNVEIVLFQLQVVSHALMPTDLDQLVYVIMDITMLELMQLVYFANILV